jgi:hypothetical protein
VRQGDLGDGVFRTGMQERPRMLPSTRNVRACKAAQAILSLALSLLAAPGGANSLQIVGDSGYLGEWELTATLREDGSTRPQKYSGPLSMKHVGLCTQDGPEEKTGEIHVQMSSSPSRLQATLWLDGVECGLSDFCMGLLNCPGRESVPLKLWVK